jgi:hypothetical protein
MKSPRPACRLVALLGIGAVVLAAPAFAQDCPELVGFYDTPGSALGVAVAGAYAYVADRFDGLRVIDVSNPAAPFEVGFYDTPGAASGVAVAGAYAYVADEFRGLRVVDVSNPAAPVEVGFYDTSGTAWGVAVAGSYAYVADDDSGLRVFDVSDPAAPFEVGYHDTPGYAQAVAVAGSYAYVADGHFGLRVVDVSNPAAPFEVGYHDTPGYANAVAVAGAYAYVADEYAGLRVVDVSNPAAPFEVGYHDTPGTAWDVAVAGSYAYVADGDFGLRAVAVSNPAAPFEVGYYDTPGNAQAVAVAGSYAYVADFDSGLEILTSCSPAPDPRECFIPAVAVAVGAQGAFFQTDVEINNTGAEAAEVFLQWLPRGEDNAEPVSSEAFTLASGASLRFDNVLTEVFGLEPDSLGALKMVASTESVIGMSRTYNIPGSKTAGTFGQGLPAIRATEMIQGSEPQRIIFLSEDPDSRANVGCVNGRDTPVRITLELYDGAGTLLTVKTMNLGPWSNNQMNRIFGDYAPVNGCVDVSSQTAGAAFYCYGSVLDNLTSDPTTVLPQTTSGATIFIPAAALAAGLEGAFFQTDLDLNNAGSSAASYQLGWLPRGADNTTATMSDPFTLAAGASVRYESVLAEAFGLVPDEVGALVVEADSEDLLAMSRTYNMPSVKVAGTFGQELPGITPGKMIPTGVKKRIIFMNENDDVRSNVGCQNAGLEPATVKIELHSSNGEVLATKTMHLPPLSNDQITRVFRDFAPISAGYVDVWTNTDGASIYCYGSVLDNLTSDPTTVLPQ